MHENSETLRPGLWLAMALLLAALAAALFLFRPSTAAAQSAPVTSQSGTSAPQ